MRVIDMLQMGTSALKKTGVVEYDNDARILLESVLHKSRTELFLAAQSVVEQPQQQQYARYINRRKKREPVAYILGIQEFWSLPFLVSPDVLIPRPETEFLLDQVFALTDPENFSKGNILDLCSGSGVISTILSRETGRIVVAADISRRALRMTQKNAELHAADGKVIPVLSDLFDAFCQYPVFSLIVSNPPYVSRYDLDNSLEPEVDQFEPHLALDGGFLGFEIILKIRRDLPKILHSGGQFFMEIGADQGEYVRELFASQDELDCGFQDVEILVDYAGRDRVLYARKV